MPALPASDWSVARTFESFWRFAARRVRTARWDGIGAGGGSNLTKRSNAICKADSSKAPSSRDSTRMRLVHNALYHSAERVVSLRVNPVYLRGHARRVRSM
eukprot:594156-Prorocentrum_minimum.AAC.2